MRIKLEENLGPSTAEIFREAGHDVVLTVDQGLGGREDRVLIEVCRAEERCLVTLDLDFANILNFPPRRYAGIAVIRLPEPMTLEAVQAGARTLLRALEQRTIQQKLWIVHGSKIREYWSGDEDEASS